MTSGIQDCLRLYTYRTRVLFLAHGGQEERGDAVADGSGISFFAPETSGSDPQGEDRYPDRLLPATSASAMRGCTWIEDTKEMCKKKATTMRCMTKGHLPNHVINDLQLHITWFVRHRSDASRSEVEFWLFLFSLAGFSTAGASEQPGAGAKQSKP
jgi:hypothetical protein